MEVDATMHLLARRVHQLGRLKKLLLLEDRGDGPGINACQQPEGEYLQVAVFAVCNPLDGHQVTGNIHRLPC